MATTQQHDLDLFSRPLNSRLGSRNRYIESFCKFLLGKPLIFCENKSLAVIRGKAVNKLFDIWKKVSDDVIKWVFRYRGHFWYGRCRLVCTIVIGNSVSCYLIDPALKFVCFSQGVNMSMYLEKDILQDILCAWFIPNAFEDKVFESNVEFFLYSFSCRDHTNSSFFCFVSRILHLHCTLCGARR